MVRVLFAFIVVACSSVAFAAEWRVQPVNAPARVSAVETVEGQVRVMAGGLWYKIALTGEKASLVFIDPPPPPKLPEGALPDGRVITGSRDIARAWLSEPVARYDHGILGDTIEAGSLVIETREGKSQIVQLKQDAVFEDLEPRLADLDGKGRDSIVLVKSSLKRGSSLAIIAERRGKYEIVAETPPLGAAHRWLDPAGIADFTGAGKIDIALVRQPHVVGMLEIWSWRDGELRKVAELADVANHVAGSRAIDMSAIADFDGDGIADIAIPSLDRSRLRIVSFVPSMREIASVPLPAKAVTDLGLLKMPSGLPAIAVGLADGTLALIRRDQ